jgi:succinylglutamate desuccinylase
MTHNAAVDPSVLADLEVFLSHAATGPFHYEACHHFHGQAPLPHVVIGFVIHGNEVGSLRAAVALQQELIDRPPPGPVTLLLGNLDAVAQGVRYVEEDFNRVFTFDRPAESLERRRAERVRPILDRADYFLDFHQTGTPTESAFWTMPWTRELGLLARAIDAAPCGVTRRATQAFSPGLMCLDEYVRAKGKLGITVELGERGVDRAQAQNCLEAARRIIEIAARVASGATLDELANERPAVSWLETAQVVPSEGGRRRLRPGLTNFTRLRAGEELGAPGFPPIPCPVDGFALFPTYVEPGESAPPELVRIAREVTDPDRTFGG